MSDREQVIENLRKQVKSWVAELPRTPLRWADQAAVSKLITAVLDIRDYYDTNFDSIVCDDSPIPFLRPLSEIDLEALERNYVRLARGGDFKPLLQHFLYSDRALSHEARELIVEKATGRFKTPRDKGRPPRPPAERESISILPEAEGLFFGIWGLLRNFYPKQKYPELKSKDVDDRALLLTVRRVKWLLDESDLTTTKLANFIGRDANDPKRYGKPKPKRAPITVAQYLNIG